MLLKRQLVCLFQALAFTSQIFGEFQIASADSLPDNSLEARAPGPRFGTGRTICSANSCGRKRDDLLLDDGDDVEGEEWDGVSQPLVEEEEDQGLSTPSELTKRALPKATKAYIMDTVDGIMQGTHGQNGNWKLIADDSTSTSVFQLLGNEPVNVGTYGLCGCTCLFLVSDTAVYAAHYFENLSFEDDAGFNEQVTRFLENRGSWQTGRLRGSYPGLAGVTEHFTQNTKAFILTPRKDIAGPGKPARFSSTAAEYGEHYIPALKQTVANIVPGLDPEVHLYKPTDCDDEDALFGSPTGHALFEFDPTDSAKRRLLFESKQVL